MTKVGTTTDADLHQVTFDQGLDLIYYLLWAGDSGSTTAAAAAAAAREVAAAAHSPGILYILHCLRDSKIDEVYIHNAINVELLRPSEISSLRLSNRKFRREIWGLLLLSAPPVLLIPPSVTFNFAHLW